MESVSDTFPFRSNEYYLSLIDWGDGHDPLRRIVLLDPSEISGRGCLDSSCEKDFTRKPGLQHKYRQTGLLSHSFARFITIIKEDILCRH